MNRTRLFFIFAKFFGIFDDFFKFHTALSVLHFERSSNMPKKKNQKNPCSNCPKPIYWLTLSARKPNFGHKIRHYVVRRPPSDLGCIVSRISRKLFLTCFSSTMTQRISFFFLILKELLLSKIENALSL